MRPCDLACGALLHVLFHITPFVEDMKRLDVNGVAGHLDRGVLSSTQVAMNAYAAANRSDAMLPFFDGVLGAMRKRWPEDGVGSLPCDELRMLLFESLRAGALDTRDGAAYSVASAFRSELVYVKANEEAASPTFGAVHVRLQVALVSPRVTASSGQLQTKCRDVLCMLDQYFGFRNHA